MGEHCLNSAIKALFVVVVVVFALSLIQRGDNIHVSKASLMIAKVRNDAKKFRANAEEQVKRLENLESWIQQQQESHQWEIKKLENQLVELKKQDENLCVEVAKVEANIKYYDELVQTTNSEIRELKKKRGNARENAVTVGFFGFFLAPFTCGLSLVPAAVVTIDQAIKASNLGDKVKKYEGEKDKLQSKVSDLKSRKSHIYGEKQKCQTQLNILQQKQDEMYEQLREIKKIIATSLQYVKLLQELSAATVDFDQSGRSFKRLINWLLESRDMTLIHRNGTQTRIAMFRDAWLDVENILNQLQETVFSFTFVCSRCSNMTTRLPWGINATAVICTTCDEINATTAVFSQHLKLLTF